MATIDFFMSDQDSCDLVAFLFKSVPLEFVPEKSPTPPPFPSYSTPNAVHERIVQDRHYSRFFLLSPAWQEFPLCFSEINSNDGSHFFSVKQRYGGPAFDLVLARTVSEAQMRWIVPGSFSHYPYYYSCDASVLPDNSECATFDCPPAMKQSYGEVQKYIRANGTRSVCKEDGRVGPWIMSGALKEFEKATWLRTGDWHFVPKSKKSHKGERGK